jgi:hypothetical protein
VTHWFCTEIEEDPVRCRATLTSRFAQGVSAAKGVIPTLHRVTFLTTTKCEYSNGDRQA